MATAELQRLTDYSVNMDQEDVMEVRGQKNWRQSSKINTDILLDWTQVHF